MLHHDGTDGQFVFLRTDAHERISSFPFSFFASEEEKRRGEVASHIPLSPLPFATYVPPFPCQGEFFMPMLHIFFSPAHKRRKIKEFSSASLSRTKARERSGRRNTKNMYKKKMGRMKHDAK